MKVVGIAGWSGAGKTTLLERLIPCLRGWGRTVSVIKHAHHRFDIDRPGKDSWRHREAGATEVLITSAGRWALLHELRDAAEPSLDAHLARLSPCDLVLVEGYRHAAIPKIEVFRPAAGQRPLFPGDPAIVALATDDAPAALSGHEHWLQSGRGRCFDLDAIDDIARFIDGLPSGQRHP